jgi:hypothetical protein
MQKIYKELFKEEERVKRLPFSLKEISVIL